jgi:KAP family P-loop domain
MTRNKLSFLFVFYLKYFVMALAVGEVAQLAWATYWAVDQYFILKGLAHTFYKTLAVGTLYLLVIYFYVEESLEPLFKLVRHDQFAVLAAGSVGLVISFNVGLFGKNYYALLSDHMAIKHISALFVSFMALMFIASIVSIVRAISKQTKNDEGFLLSDEPITDPSQDGLGLSSQAKTFADKVYNSGAQRSIVFGLDAPWGIGKTSFLNLMKFHWDENYKSKKNKSEVVVFSFDPLKFSQSENLSDRFIEEVVHVISQKFPVPELSTLLGGYARYLRGISGISFFGLQIGFANLGLSNGYRERLEGFIEKPDMKLIVVIEDLDRLPIMEARQILYSMKSAFDLPNISFLVCYDSQNLSNAMSVHLSSKAEVHCKDGGHALAITENGGPDNLLEFLEKFIHVKVPIFVETRYLVSFMRHTIFELLSKNGGKLDEDLVNTIANALEAMLGSEQEKSTAYYYGYIGELDKQHKYEKIIRDPRKIKRLLNHLQFLDFLDDSVFGRVDETDFLNLLLLYINFPDVFRHVYQVEMGPRSGYFTSGQVDDDKATTDKYLEFEKYCKQVSPSAAFLLDQIFNRKISDYLYAEEEDVKRISAKHSHNLKVYLEIITKQRELPSEESHKFQLEMAKKMHKNPLGIMEMYSGNDYDVAGDEAMFRLFWLNFVNTGKEMRGEYDREKADKLIEQGIDIIPKHSALKIDKINLGLRNELPRRLLAILDSIGWDFKADGGRNNSPDNLLMVAQRILGLEPFQGAGILDKLGSPDRGVLGLFDQMLFRLYLLPSRGNNYFNLSKALGSLQGSDLDLNGPNFAIDSMRNVSQIIFQKFIDTFVTPQFSLFTAIDKLSLEELSGGRTSFIEQKVSEGQISKGELEHSIRGTKSMLKKFISYHLGSYHISQGRPGCGYYDLEGSADNKGINLRYNKYLFNIAFNPTISEDAHQQFLEYLLLNAGSKFNYQSEKRLFKLEEYSQVLEVEMLRSYVALHRGALDQLLGQLASDDMYVVIGDEDYRYREYQSDFLVFFNSLPIEVPVETPDNET